MEEWQKKFLNKQVCGNNLELLKQLPDDCVHLTITSPPYNVELGNNKYNKKSYDLYKDNKEHNEFLSELKQRFEEVYRVTIMGGKVCINIGDSKNGAIPTHSDIIQMMAKELKYIPYSIIIWDKKQTSNRAAWGSFNSPSSPSFPQPFEYILIFSKGGVKRNVMTKESDLTKEEFIKYAYGLWEFPPETRMKEFGHPAMFPEELPKRLIKMLSWKDDVIMDMYGGAGTTAYVAKNLNRNFISIDLSEKYCKTANERTGLNQDTFDKYC